MNKIHLDLSDYARAAITKDAYKIYLAYISNVPVDSYVSFTDCLKEAVSNYKVLIRFQNHGIIKDED